MPANIMSTKYCTSSPSHALRKENMREGEKGKEREEGDRGRRAV